jgi:WD40 repeat protein
MYAAGSRVHFYDVITSKQSYLRSLSGQAVGAVAVHPSKQYISVAETGRHPVCCVYAYPSRKLYRVLRGGTERAFSAASFDHAGNQLATVGSFPDYMLTVWDWKAESIVLRSKAFSQEVFRVTFSPYVDGSLITSGTGHIRFWRMASTFTGIKLQGDIGKFGTVELTDVRGYVELPSGKVLSGTDWGNFLLWNGNLIECEVCREGGRKCHDGPVNFLTIDGDRILSAADDGRLIQWDLKIVEAAEVSEETPVFQLAPLGEMSLAGREAGREKARLQSLARAPDGQWLVQDGAGALYKADLPIQLAMPVLQFHAGAITGLDASPSTALAATCGADGTVRVWSYVDRALLFTHRFAAGASCLTWASLNVDTSARTLAVGFSDGTLRVLQVCRDGLRLLAALKPHATGIRHVLYSPDGSLLVTTAADASVFFIDATKSYAALGFMQLPAPATAACWAADGASLLVSHGHELVALAAPEPGTLDSTQTFFLPLAATPLGLEEIRAVVLSRRMAEREAVRAAAKAKYLQEHPAPPEDPDLASEIEAARVELEAEEEAARGPVTAPALVARSLLPQPDGSLLVAVDSNSVSLGVWRLGPAGCAPTQLREDTPVTCWLGGSQRYITTAGVDGSVTLAPQMGGAYWEAHLHQSLRLDEAGGTIARLSFDDAYLLAASTDGTFFVLGVQEVQPDTWATGAAGLPVRSDTGATDAPDIDPAAYSLEEAKQQAESDARAAAADRAKMTVRERMVDLRHRFNALLARNEAAAPADRLPRESLMVDPGLRERIREETEGRLAAAREEMAWTSEAGAVALAKLQARFVEPLEVEDITLRGLASGETVRSIRTPKLAPWQVEAIDAVHTLIDAETTARGGTAGHGTARKLDSLGGAGGRDPAGDDNAEDGEGGAGAGCEAGAKEGGFSMSKAEMRAARRAERAKVWAAFRARQPADGYSDPADVAAIEVAKATLGAFALKADPDYVVPEALRVNAQKKRRQLILLDESVHAIKMAYNDRFLGLRKLKNNILAELAADHARVEAIEAELGVEVLTRALPATLAPEEEPEARSVVTAADRAAHAVVEAKNGGGGGFGGFADGGVAPKATAGEAEPTHPAQGKPSGEDAALQFTSPVAEGERALLRSRLQFELRRLLERRSVSVASFDAALEELRAERFRLLADLEAAELRRIALSRELRLLKDFEKRDSALASKLSKAHADQTEVGLRVSDCQEKLSVKKVQMEKMVAADKAIMEQFTKAVGERHKAFDALLKIFRRKIKRSRKPAEGTADKAGGGDETESESEAESESEDKEEEEEEEEVCPAGCEAELYAAVCQLREARLDQEKAYNDFQKGVDAIKRENDILVKRETGIANVLHETEQEIQTFQAEKQAKLNELFVMLTLAASQVDVAAGKLPADMSSLLVFPTDALRALQARPEEIAEEKGELRRRQKALRVEHATMLRDQEARQVRADEHAARLRDVQMLKFGQLVDIEALDAVGVNRSAEEVRRRIAAAEAKQAEELRLMRKELASSKFELKEATEQSTAKLKAVATLFERQQKLETDLNKGQASAPQDTAGERRERQRLVSLVKVQAREVEALKIEVNMLRRKGGHVYSATEALSPALQSI